MKHLVGFHAVTSRLRQKPESIREVYVDAERVDARAKELREFAKSRGVRVIAVDSKRLDGMAGGARHQGVVATAEELDMPRFIEDVLERLEEPALFLILDGVQDPHNLGACLRTADACGVLAVVVPRDRSATLNATARKVAAGAAETTPVVTVTNLARSLKLIKEAGLWIVGADARAAHSAAAIDLTGGRCLVMGSEGLGLRELTRRNCDWLVHLPSLGSVESLNVSVATGMLLYEALRQRQSAPAPRR
jgi:23S rRNA (guanosine2251-2'-O)-methyltransferase